MPSYSGPRMKLRANVRIPARVVSGPGISQVIADGVLTTGLDIESLDVAASIPDPSIYEIFIWNTATEEWESTPLDNVPTTTTGDAYTGHGDSAFIIANTDRYIALTAALTAPRAWTLPAASAVPAGTRITFHDEIAGVTSTNTLTFGPTGADTINGATTFVLNVARAGIEFRSDGISKWTVGLVGTSAVADGFLAATTAGLAKMADGFLAASTAALAKMAAGFFAVSTDALAKFADGFWTATAGARAKFADGIWTNAKLADMAAATLKGSLAGGVPADLTGAQVRDGITPAGALIDRAYDEYTAATSLSTATPFDDTIPQVSEGTQILSATITPKSTTNRVRVEFKAFAASGTTSAAVTAHLHINGAANASQVATAIVTVANSPITLGFDFESVPSSVSAQTYTIRVGANGVSCMVNGTGGGRLFGGAARATLHLTEIKA